MKEMVYTANRISPPDILDAGEYKGYEYAILNLGYHPCAYVGIPKGHSLYKKEYSQASYEISCHGGFTYAAKGLVAVGMMKDKWVLGWDYAHAYDYAGYNINFPEYDFSFEKKWTTEEILNEVHDVIDQIINLDSNDLKQRSDK